jgi:hypothetical protein
MTGNGQTARLQEMFKRFTMPSLVRENWEATP